MPSRYAMLAFYAAPFVLPPPPGHRFPMRKCGMLREAVAGGYGSRTEDTVAVHAPTRYAPGDVRLALKVAS